MRLELERLRLLLERVSKRERLKREGELGHCSQAWSCFNHSVSPHSWSSVQGRLAVCAPYHCLATGNDDGRLLLLECMRCNSEPLNLVPPSWQQRGIKPKGELLHFSKA